MRRALGCGIKSQKPYLADDSSAAIEKILRGLKNKPIVMDIIYRPLLTKFLRDAKHAGCRVITGDKMFLVQAAESFELWTGKKMP